MENKSEKVDNSNDNCINDSTEPELRDNNIPIPKKRGRKRKSDQVALNVAVESPSRDEIELSTARSGRKRKSVNYFSLANPDITEASNDDVQEVGVGSPKKRNDRQIPSKTNDLNTRCSKENIVTEPKGIKKDISDFYEFSDQEKNVKTESDVATSANIAESEVQEGADKEEKELIDSHSEVPTEDGELERHVIKEKVYRKTGCTVRMMNTLLSQADFKTNVPVKESVMERPIKRGRPSKNKKKDHADSNTEGLDDSSKNTVTCAVCNKEIEKGSWPHHKQRFHNNLAWRVGEPPLDLSNMDLVKQILNAMYVAKKPFYCDNCDKVVKSVHGFLSHKSTCGKTTEEVKVSCQYCGRKMLPISLPSHIRNAHELKEKVKVVTRKRSPSTGTKRKAAENAMKVIHNIEIVNSEKFEKNFDELPFISSKEAATLLANQINTLGRVQCKYPDCNFECFTFVDIKNHLKFCILKPDDGYVCRHCLQVQLNIADMICHIESVHSSVIGNENEDEETSNAKSKQHKKKEKQQPQKNGRCEWPPCLLPSDRTVNVVFQKAYEWTLKFCDDNYSTVIPENHFPCLERHWDYMDVDIAEDYFPKMAYSCDVGFETVVGFQSVLNKDHTFRKFELFESYLENNGNSTIFCGGPITALSWMPTPYENNGIHQIVAVATKSHPDAQYETAKNYNEKCFIQFWDVGPLKNTETSLFRPRQEFCLQFEHGPIWDLQWCPSNCYDLSKQPKDSKKLRRMGVLAVAASDSSVYIYSIPKFNESGQFYNARPVLKLVLNIFEGEKLGNKDYYATRMSWTKAAGHKYLAVGYSNGQVAVYNLWTNSELLRYKSNQESDLLMPITVFEAHHSSITAIALHHSHDGCKWLMTGSYDRNVHTWDLENNYPVRTMKGNIVNDAVWMTNWMCHIIAYDEASTIGNACSAIHQCKEDLSDPLYLFHCSSAITSLSGSDWLNGIIQANSVGEVFATFPKQLMMNLNWKNLKNKKLLFGFTTLIEKDKTIEERLIENSEKEKALRNKLKVKTKIKTEELPSDREVMHLDYNPHYYEYEPLVYHEMDEKYGLIFCDHKMKEWKDFPPKLQEHMSHSSDKYAQSRPNMYPLQSITKIDFNMNRQASVYYASGYQAGFIRVTYMKFLDKDPLVVGDSEKMKN